MEREREEESGEMYSSNESEYMLHGDAPTFSVQGLRDALTEAVCSDRTITPSR